MWQWTRKSASLPHTAALTFAGTLLASPFAQLHDDVVLILPLTLVALRLGSSKGAWWQLVAAAGITWLLATADVLLHRWIEQEGIWRLLSQWLGEDKVA